MTYRGPSIILPIGLRGFNGSKNPSRLGPDHLQLTENVDLDGGILLKEGGASKLNSSALGAPSKVLAGINWSPVSSQNDDVIFLGNGSALRDQGLGTFPTTLASGLAVTEEPPPFFIVAGGEAVGSTRKLFMFSIAHQVQVLSGTAATMAALTTPPADWASSFPSFGVQHINRLWGGGNASDPHRIYYSTITNHQDFTGAGSGQLPIFPGEGSIIVGAVSFRGILVVWKYPFGIYTVDTRDPTVANWQIQRVSSSVGGVNAQTILQIENDILFLDQGGNIHALSVTNDLGDITSSNLSDVDELGAFVRANVNLTNIQRACALWYAPKSKAWFMLPANGATNNNLRVQVDYGDKERGPRFLTTRRDIGVSAWTRPDGTKVRRPTLGDASGFVWLMDKDAKNKDNAAYTMSFETADLDMAFASPELGGLMKQNVFLEIATDLVQGTALVVTPIWDNLEQSPVLFELGTSSIGLDTFILNTHALSGSGVTRDRRRVPGSGRSLRFIVEHSELNVDLRIIEFRLAFDVADERIRQ